MKTYWFLSTSIGLLFAPTLFCIMRKVGILVPKPGFEAFLATWDFVTIVLDLALIIYTIYIAATNTLKRYDQRKANGTQP